MSEILDGTYLPAVVETVRSGSRSRELAPVGSAYTRLPIYARRDIHLGSSSI
ncbi:MAG: hypothetical protein HC801_10860 [Nitrospira sp.]|nr:hypothetical protein [Nitrospira sp.]